MINITSVTQGRSASAATSAQTLIEHDLIDEYRLMIDPLVVGSGRGRLYETRRPTTFDVDPGRTV
jgi:hypothetical protein